MDESEENLGSEDLVKMESLSSIKAKPKKRSLVERELETNLTPNVTSPATNCDNGCTSRYGRARRSKTDAEFIDTKKGIQIMTSPVFVKTPAKTQSPAYKMHAFNSPIKTEPKETPEKVMVTDSSLDNQIDNIYSENISMSRFGSDEKKSKSSGNKFPKVYVRKDLIQTREKEEYVMMIKNMFSPVQSSQKSNTHLNNILERSSEKYCLNKSTENPKSQNGILNNSSVVKTLDFDGNKKKKKENRDGKVVLSKSDLFDMEAKCEYQVGDLAWARMGTFPFWPCIVTREPASGMFVKKKLFGRIERDIVHVTFFGDNGRRSWIVDTMLRRFLGQLEFEAAREAFSPSTKKKDPRLYAAFFVSEKKMPQWNISVEEAETLLREPKRLRIDILYDMLAKARSSKCTPKQHKSGKITRTASDVASDVSLSESLYDTLFSEDDGKSEDTEKSRSKTRVSLDVSEVVTACLDNMAAKTGIIKIQRQSHMDRWLQKAKSKTPEKLQANLPTQQKELKPTSVKKKKKISPIRIPVQKPYSFRKTSYEPQILKPHDDEHDYSTKISNCPPQKSAENLVTTDSGEVSAPKVESLHEKTDDSAFTINSETLKEETAVTPQKNAKNNIEIGSIDGTEEQINEIQENLCSIEENNELLLGHIDKPSLDTEKQSGAAKLPDKNSMDTDKQEDEPTIDANKNSTKNNETIEDVVNKIDEDCIDIKIEVNIAQKPDKHPVDETKSSESTHVVPGTVITVKPFESKVLANSRKKSAQFHKYLELRQDSVLDEYPELSQDEIVDYLYKTWEYEESSKCDFQKNDNTQHSVLVKGLNTNSRQRSRKNENRNNKKKLSLNSNARKRTEDMSPTNTFLSSSSNIRSLGPKLSDSSTVPMDTDGNSSTEAIESTQIVIEHNYTEKIPEMTPKEHEIDTPKQQKHIDVEKVETPPTEANTSARRSLRTKLSLSPASPMDKQKVVSRVSKDNIAAKAGTSTQAETKDSNSENLPKIKLSSDGHGVTQKLSKSDIDKEKSEPTLMLGNTSTRRSLRAKLSDSPATSINTNETNSYSLSNNSITLKASMSAQDIPELSNTETLPETKQRSDEIETDKQKLSESNIYKEKEVRPIIVGSTTIRRSLRAKLPHSPAISTDIKEIDSIRQASITVKPGSSTQGITELSNTKSVFEIKPSCKEIETDSQNLSESSMVKEKVENNVTGDSNSAKKNLKAKLPKSSAIIINKNKIIKLNKESIPVKSSTSIQAITKHSDTENLQIDQNSDKTKRDTPNAIMSNMDEEKVKTTLIVGGTSARKILSVKTSKSSDISYDKNEIINSVNRKKITVEPGTSTQAITEHSITKELPTMKQNLDNNETDQSEVSKSNADEEKVKTTLIVSETSVRKSLRVKLSKSPAISNEKNERINSVNKESITVEPSTSTQATTEHSITEKLPTIKQNLDKNETDKPEVSKSNADEEKVKTTLIVGETSVRKSLRVKLPQSPAISNIKNEIINSVNKESITVKPDTSTQAITELNIDILPKIEQKPEQVEKDYTKRLESKIDDKNINSTLIVSDTSARKSFRAKLSISRVKKDILPEKASNDRDPSSNTKVLRIDSPKQTNSNMDKKIDTITENSTPVTRRHNTRLTNSATNSTDSKEIISNACKETSTVKADETVTEHRNTENPEVNKSPDESSDMDKVEATPTSSIRRRLRTRLLNTPAVSMATVEYASNDNTTTKTIEPAQRPEKQPAITKMGKMELDTPEKAENVTLVGNKHNASTEYRVEVKNIELDEPRIDGVKQLNTNLIVAKHEATIVTGEPTRNLEKSIEVVKSIEKESMETQHETIQKTEEQSTAKTSNENTTSTGNSCIETEKSKEMEVTDSSDKLALNVIEKPVISCVNSNNQNDVSQSVDENSTETQNKIVDKAIEITQIAELPSIVQQAKTALLMDDDDEIPDEDKEYGHLDFVFSALDEKLLATNDVSQSVIKSNVSTDIKDSEKTNNIQGLVSHDSAPTSMDSRPNKRKRSNSHRKVKIANNFHYTETDGCIHKGSDTDNCKYKKLYDSCTEVRVRVEKLPRLSHRIINIKDLDKEILLGNVCQNEINSSIDTNNKIDKIVSEKKSKSVIENVNDKAITPTDDAIQDIASTFAKENESKISADYVQDDVICRSLEKVHECIVEEKVNNVTRESFEKMEESIVEERLYNVAEKSLENVDKSSVDEKRYNISDKSLEKPEESIVKPINNEGTKIDFHVSEKLAFNEKSDEKISSNIPETKQSDKNIVTDVNLPVKEDLLLKENDIEPIKDKLFFQPVVVKSEGIECVQIKPSPLTNGFQYIFDEDDEEEFESPAFSPIFKEPINTTPDNKDNGGDNKELEAVTNKKDTITTDNNMPKDSTELLLSKDTLTGIQNQKVVMSVDANALRKEEIDVARVKDEVMTSVSRLPEPVKINGYHLDEYGLDCSDNDFNVETSSVNSEDSEPLSITKTKLLSKKRKDAKKALQDSEFVKYLELRQDALMDEHPELNQDEIVEYLYKTWQYEENSKSNIVKNDDIEQAGLVKGLNDNLRQKSIRNSYRENKKKNTKRDDDTLSLSSNISRKESIKREEDTLSINSDVSDTSMRRRLRTRLSNSPVISMHENEFCVSKESSPERQKEDTVSIDSEDTIKITKRKVRNQILDDSLDGDESFSVKEEPLSNSETPMKVVIKTEETRPRKSAEKRQSKSPKSNNDSIKKYFAVVNTSTESKTKHKNEQNTVDVEKKIKEEYDPDTVSIASVNSEDSEVSLSKRKQRKAEKQTTKSMNDPEFLKYVELRQDVLIDENPQLTQEEIFGYLYKTWLYEENAKSDIKKSDDIEQANLVKGLSSEVPPKKVRKKIKAEKNVEEEVASKDKPKRKISQPFYYEDMSDIEDELELFEIFKTAKKPTVIKSEEANGEINKTNEVPFDVVKTEVPEVVVHDEIDEVELYFSQLPLPKPNVFKGLVREKVCEICEKTGNLVKCKGCSGMFHVECEKKVVEESVVASTRGRKKKKKPGRKPKNFEDSGSHSDEKSQDVSEEHNVSVEEVEAKPRVVDEAVIEAALTAKMKELLPTIDLTYDSYSSDDGLDWNSAEPGQCEIVDIKIKPKIVIDYSDFKCKNCQIYSTPVCFVCQLAVSKTGVDHRQKCQTNHCNKYYHLECLDHWPQTQFNSGEPSKSNKKINEHFESLMCPRHVCHTCVSDDPRGCKTRFSGDKLARCVKCPATYHTFTKCLPAGTQILTGSLIVCPRHYEHRAGKVPCHVNTGWCFICALGGSLICCEYCPTSFHAECLNIDPPEGTYMCEDCETGRLPLYGEMVWVKLGHYRWWPGIILHPSEIPENIMAVKHYPGEFVVRFFGQYDHYWVNRGRVFPFQEGDSGRVSAQKSKIDAAFITAIEHAHRAFEILKTAEPNDEESIDIASSLLPPHYVKLKVNKACGPLAGRRPDEESSLTQCECEPRVEDPCGPYSHCLNRMLLTECGPICRAGDRCNNRAFEKRLYPKMVPYRTPHRGWGLKTLEDIRAGQFVIEYVGELIDEEEFKRRMNRMHEIRDENFYFLTLDKERMIDAGPKGNLARFMNHCCEPNCETQKWTVLGDVRVGLFAIRDIPANSELTFNYNLECTGIEKKRCLCGARRCSGYIGAKPKQEETQPKKKRAYKKRAKPAEESPSTSKIKPKRPVGRPAKPRELTEIEKDLLIIKNATNGISSDSECSSRLSSIDNPKALKRKRVSFSTEESLCSSPSTKKSKFEDSSPSTKISNSEENSPSVKKAKIEDTPPSLKNIEETPPSMKKMNIEEKNEVGD